MTMQGFIAALGLPDSCWINQRVPKKLLIEKGARTTVDKRLINEGIEEIRWLAALKPSTIGVSEYRDEVREYLEIALLTATLRADSEKSIKSVRLSELIHRAIPYPVILILSQGDHIYCSLAHKRWAQNESDKVVLAGSVVAVTLPKDITSPVVEMDFMKALALGRQPQTTLYTLYQGWMDSLQALLAANLTGAFKSVNNPEKAAERRAALHRCEELEIQVASLRLAASKEKQMARQVSINLEIKALQTERMQVIESL